VQAPHNNGGAASQSTGTLKGVLAGEPTGGALARLGPAPKAATPVAQPARPTGGRAVCQPGRPGCLPTQAAVSRPAAGRAVTSAPARRLTYGDTCGVHMVRRAGAWFAGLAPGSPGWRLLCGLALGSPAWRVVVRAGACCAGWRLLCGLAHGRAAGTPLGRAFARGARTEREPVQEPGGEHLLLRDAPFFFFVMPR
jgi:hypothetical protein